LPVTDLDKKIHGGLGGSFSVKKPGKGNKNIKGPKGVIGNPQVRDPSNQDQNWER